jgi:hypothetical protein
VKQILGALIGLGMLLAVAALVLCAVFAVATGHGH